MHSKTIQRVFILRLRAVEEFSGASTTNSPLNLFVPKSRLRKFSNKPEEATSEVQNCETWKINREQDEFCIDSPLRMLCGHSSFQVQFVTLQSPLASKCVRNTINVTVKSSQVLKGFFRYAKNVLFPILHNLTIESSEVSTNCEKPG